MVFQLVNYVYGLQFLSGSSSTATVEPKCVLCFVDGTLRSNKSLTWYACRGSLLEQSWRPSAACTFLPSRFCLLHFFLSNISSSFLLFLSDHQPFNILPSAFSFLFLQFFSLAQTENHGLMALMQRLRKRFQDITGRVIGKFNWVRRCPLSSWSHDFFLLTRAPDMHYVI